MKLNYLALTLALSLVSIPAHAQVTHSERGYAISVAGFVGYQDVLTVDVDGPPSVSGVTGGVRGGIEYKVGSERVRVAPSVGVSIDRDGNTAMFTDAVVLYAFPRFYVGSGATGLYNDTGMEANRAGYVATAGWTFHDECLSFIGEFKHYLDTNTTKKVGWAGVKYVF